MPELPEVQTIVNYLRSRILGKKILNLSAPFPKARVFRYIDFGKAKKKLERKKIKNISRHGKSILFELADSKFLVMHLMMTGKILLDPQNPSTYDRFTLKLSGGKNLVFNDVRTFGWIRILDSDSEIGARKDALDILYEDFHAMLKKSRSGLKSWFLSQKGVAGIGNIYADEILWQAGVHPLRTGLSLSEKEIKVLFLAMRSVLKKALALQGTTSRDYRKPDGTTGNYYSIRKVYQRTGEICSKDKSLIQRILVAQRATHYCPKHQV